MKVTIDWLKDFTPIALDAKTISDGMTMSGSKVENYFTLGDDIHLVVTGRITSVAKHPDADKLVVCMVDVGDRVLQIVTGADNVRPGAVVPVALDGSVLSGHVQIKKGMLRGLASDGMLCSMEELGLTSADYPDASEDGIMLLPDHTPAGLRIQDVLGINDTVLDFEITSNRVDCLSVEGLAREAALTFDLPFEAAQPSVKALHPVQSSDQASIVIEAPDLCFRYCGRVIRNVCVGPSPDWLRRRLRAVGMRPINNIVDITNYVMLELGQPMHAFDLTQLDGQQVRVRRAHPGENMRTLDRIDRCLDTGMLVIADKNKAVALAGVMGAENSEIESATRTILLESATFNPVAVRQAALKTGLRTEASSRFEKGLDIHNAIRAMNRACQLIEQLAAGDVCQGTIDVWPVHPDPVQVTFSPSAINCFLGTDISHEWMIACLEKLGLCVEKTGSSYQAVIPSYRPDLSSEADISEEIARFYGYNQIKPSLLSGKQTTLGGRNHQQKILEKVKDILIGQGFFEACTYSFESPSQLDRLLVPAGHPWRRSIRIMNPLGEDFSCMRTSMLPSLFEVAATNWSHSVDQVRIFELGSVYLADALPLADLPYEERHLTAFIYDTSERQKTGSAYYQMKGVVEELLLHLGIVSPIYQILKNCPWLHPGQSANILLDDQVIGQIGMIHPDVADHFAVPRVTAVLDVLAEPILQAATEKRSFKPLPRYPAVSRDLALLVSVQVTNEELAAVIRQAGGPNLERIDLFDVYQGQQVPAGMKSVAYSLVFRSPERTLKEDDIQPLIQKILASLHTSHQAIRRET
jgi:phenylalanyl-tRNA synthetase beta chain